MVVFRTIGRVSRAATGDPLIAANIRAAMRRRQLTARQVAARLEDRDDRWVGDRARGTRAVRTQDLVPLARALGVPVGELLGEPPRAIEAELPGWSAMIGADQEIVRALVRRLASVEQTRRLRRVADREAAFKASE